MTPSNVPIYFVGPRTATPYDTSYDWGSVEVAQETSDYLLQNGLKDLSNGYIQPTHTTLGGTFWLHVHYVRMLSKCF